MFSAVSRMAPATSLDEMIALGDDYFDIADAIYLVADWRTRDTSKVLREAARPLLACDWRGWMEIAPQVEQQQRFWRHVWPTELKDQVRGRVGRRVWRMIERRL